MRQFAVVDSLLSSTSLVATDYVIASAPSPGAVKCSNQTTQLLLRNTGLGVATAK